MKAETIRVSTAQTYTIGQVVAYTGYNYVIREIDLCDGWFTHLTIEKIDIKEVETIR